MTGKLAWSLAALAAPVFAFAVVTGCSSAPADSSRDEGTGTIAAALTSVGTDGFTYSVPTTDVLIVSAATPGQYNCFPITSAATMSTALPAGTYTVSLATSCQGSTPDAAPEPFVLLRTGADAGATSVSATLTNPAQPITIAQGATSNVVFQFAISQTASVTMGTGTLTTGIATIDGGAVPPTHATWIVNYSSWQFSGSDAGAPLTSLFGTGTVNTPGTITITSSNVQPLAPELGDYAFGDFYNNTVAFSSTNAGLGAFGQELSQTNAYGVFQLYDQYNTPAGYSTMTEAYLGTPISTAFQNTGLCGSGAGCSFSLRQSANFNPPLYNGTSVNAGAYAQPTLVPGSSVYGTIYVGNGTTYLGLLSFNVTSSTLQLSP